ncbi:MAG: helix-turn-helix domain-containing protein [Gaiellaceae bacterium]
MFEIGESLREARTRRGLTQADVQKELRVRERYLNALEEEHWELLPGEAYVKGFLRMYAEFLGLHGGLYIDEYNARFAHPEEEPALVPEALAPRRRRARGILRTLVGIVAVGAAVAGLAAWRLGGSAAPPAAAPIAKPAARTAAPAPAAPAAKPAATARPSFAVISAPNGRCWLQVRAGGPNGALLYEGTLARGAIERFSLRHSIWVRMGNPPALAITVGGRPVTKLSSTPSNLLLTRAGAQTS